MVRLIAAAISYLVTCWLGRTRGGTEVGMGGETDCYSYKVPAG